MSSSESTASNPVAEHGWTAVPLDANTIFNGKPYLHKPTPILVADMPFPSADPLVAKVQAYAREQLPPQTYNHSMRVFYWATAILHSQFPSHAPLLSPSTLALTALLHDLGTAPSLHLTTHLSFEFRGALAAHALLLSHNSAPIQAEAVCEAIIRHQDLTSGPGTITLLGQVVQLATVYDNVGGRGYLVHEATRGDVNRAFSREGWAGCFAGTVREEVRAKPWANSTRLGGSDGGAFVNAVEGNLLMAEYEE